MSPQDRNAMIETMVARLDERLGKIRTTRKDGSGSFVPIWCWARPTRRATRWRAASRRSAKQRAGRAIAGLCGLARAGEELNDAQAEAAVGDRRRPGLSGAGGGADLFALGQKASYFYMPADLAKADVAPGQRIRLGGLVENGTVVRGEGTEVAFAVTDTEKSVKVVYTGILPDLFREEQGVITEGTFGADGVFVADSVLAKHDENYMPKEVADSLKAKGVWQEGERESRIDVDGSDGAPTPSDSRDRPFRAGAGLRASGAGASRSCR